MALPLLLPAALLTALVLSVVVVRLLGARTAVERLIAFDAVGMLSAIEVLLLAVVWETVLVADVALAGLAFFSVIAFFILQVANEDTAL